MPNGHSKKKLLVLTSGGDAPGMNAAIRAVVRVGCAHDLEVLGSLYGYQGLITQSLQVMQPASVANSIQRGGTILKSERCMAFYDPLVRSQCRDYLAKEKIDYLVVIGGDGTFRGALLLEQEGGPKTLGIPASIDNDVIGTSYTIGYDTARNTALQAIDNIRDTASSHERNFLVEVMGRNAGFLALDVGVAGGAEYVLIPESGDSIEELVRVFSSPRRKKISSIVVVSEAGHPGRSIQFAEQLKIRTEQEFRVCILGHVQRGGSPTAMDRITASQMGAMAVKQLLLGQSQQMVAVRDGELCLQPFPPVSEPSRRVNDSELLDLARVLAC